MKKGIALLLATTGLVLLFLGTRTVERAGQPNEPNPSLGFAGEKARHYLHETIEGHSLMQALTAARLGLQWQEHAPGDSRTVGGYLGLSHEQNLSGWFADDGATIRPTLAGREQNGAWSVVLEPKAYGYGEQLIEVPAIVWRHVNGNRVEYGRGSRRAEVGGQLTDSELVEWYENRAEGIEQGFTLRERPPRDAATPASVPLELMLSVRGGMQAEMKEDGQRIDLRKPNQAAVLSYSKLTAVDANGKHLLAQMKASADGSEIRLVVADEEARYPIVIDPVLTSLERKLDAFGNYQADARFGFAVAIDGDRAVVGAWREDSGSQADVGVVYLFTRTGTNWTLISRTDAGTNATDGCGWSVAISGDHFAYGCPGANNQAGRAYLRFFGNAGAGTELVPAADTRGAGNQFGYSIALSSSRVVVGAPFFGFPTFPRNGRTHFFTVDSNLNIISVSSRDGVFADEQSGTSVALSGNLAVVGSPNHNSARGRVIVYNGTSLEFVFLPDDRAPGDNFGESVDINGGTAVAGAWGDDDTAADAGSAYVFVRNADTTWTQQQKLTASDGRAGDKFSIHAVAIQDDTIVIGAGEWDLEVSGDNAGAAYVFTRTGTIWTRQTALFGDSADNYGISVDISGDTLLIGARSAIVGSPFVRGGAAYVYRRPHNLANVATRLRVESGDDALIGGFIVTGTQAKKVIVRAIGPSLPLADKLSNPTLELFQGNTLLYSNDNWVESANKQAIIDTGVAPTNDLESAIVATLPANNAQYTAVVRGANNETGIGVVEAYDLDTAVNSKLANISTRGLVQTGDNVLFAGTIVVGATTQKVIIRALGPSVPVPGRMSDPELELHDGNGALLEANDNWVDSPNKQAIIDSGIPPNHDLESAIVRTLPPANYTAIVRGFDGATGIAVVEAYALK